MPKSKIIFEETHYKCRNIFFLRETKKLIRKRQSPEPKYSPLKYLSSSIAILNPLERKWLSWGSERINLYILVVKILHHAWREFVFYNKAQQKRKKENSLIK